MMTRMLRVRVSPKKGWKVQNRVKATILAIYLEAGTGVTQISARIDAPAIRRQVSFHQRMATDKRFATSAVRHILQHRILSYWEAVKNELSKTYSHSGTWRSCGQGEAWFWDELIAKHMGQDRGANQRNC